MPYYIYSINNPPIKFKFFVGSLSLEPYFWYKSATVNFTLDDLEIDNINNTIEKLTIIGIFEKPIFIGLMNGFI